MSSLSRLCVQIVESLASGLAATPPFGTCVIHLAANPIDWSVDTPPGAITECTFDGYAPVPANYGPPSMDLEGDTVISPTAVPSFGCSGSVSSNSVQSVYVTGPGTAASAWMIGSTLPPFTPQPGMSFSVTPKVSLDGEVDACVC